MFVILSVLCFPLKYLNTVIGVWDVLADAKYKEYALRCCQHVELR